MKVHDSRRFTGINVVWSRPGAVIEVELDGGAADDAIRVWREQARRILDAIGWADQETSSRKVEGGVMLALSAPHDTLYAATEVNDWAWDAANAVLSGGDAPPLDEAVDHLCRAIASESKPRLRALAAAAAERGVAFLHGEDAVTLGLGAGSQTWPEDDPPDAGEVDWSGVHDVPVALVTGTNGKSTTVRLTAAIAKAAGRCPGLCSSDWVRVGDDILEAGDFSGPGGARAALRDRRTEIAVLEVARGGLMRRGLAVARADAALITNVAADHLGDFGVHDVAALADAKFVVARAVAGGRLLLNADDAMLAARGAALDRAVTWYGLDADGDPAASSFIADDHFVALEKGRRRAVLPVADFPLGMAGRARHNLANGVAAIALARALGLPLSACAEGLAGFESGPRDNPGRSNLFDIGGVTVLVDFAHNPHGVEAMLDTARRLPAARRAVLLGQAGDRRDEDIRAMTRVVWRFRPELIVVKEMESVLRGRAPGEVPRLITGELARIGVPREIVRQAPTELDAVRQAFDWARPGDLLLLLVHAQRAEVFDLIEGLRARERAR